MVCYIAILLCKCGCFYLILDPEGEWTAHKVELALWTEVMARKYNFDILSQTHMNGCEQGVNSKMKRKAEEVPRAKRPQKRAKK